jgi:hypothetical protein
MWGEGVKRLVQTCVGVETNQGRVPGTSATWHGKPMTERPNRFTLERRVSRRNAAAAVWLLGAR